MGFLDKLLGRTKETAGDVGDAAKDMGDKAKDAFDGGGDGTDAPGTSEVTEAEQRLDDVRDRAMQDEGRIP